MRGGKYVLKPPTFEATLDTVPLTVVVRDRKGHPLSGLTRDRFQVWDNGRALPLSAFSALSAAPVPTPESADTKTNGVQPVPTIAPRPMARAVPGRSVVLLFDDVNSDGNALAFAGRAATRFVHEELNIGDRVALFTTSDNVNVGLGSSRAALDAGFARLAAHPRSSDRGVNSCPRITPYQAYLIVVLHDNAATNAAEAEANLCNGGGNQSEPAPGSQINPAQNSDPIHMQAKATWEMERAVSQSTLAYIHSVVDYLAVQPAPRVLVLASNGFLTETLEGQLDGILEDAQRHGIVISGLDAKGLATTGPGRPWKEMGDEGQLPLASFFFDEESKVPLQFARLSAMANLAEGTGGLLFQNNNDLALGFRRLGMVPAASYELAIAPHPLPHDGKLHKLRVELSPPVDGATVEYRRAYFAPPPGPTRAQLALQFDQAMRVGDPHADLTIAVTAAPKPGGVEVRIAIDAAKLAFTSNHGRHDQDVEVAAGLFHSQASGTPGSFVTGERGTIRLALKGSTLDHYRKAGLKGLQPSFTLKAPPGDYVLRVVVQEASDGKLATITRTVQIAAQPAPHSGQPLIPGVSNPYGHNPSKNIFVP